MEHKCRTKKAIGILEDNFSLRSNIERYLTTTQQFEVVFSEPNTTKLYEHQQGQHPDIILLDVHLQGENSLDLISYMKEQFPEVSIIIMTGDNDEQLIMQAFENGASGYIYKPFKLAELTETIKKLEEDGSYMQPLVATKLINLLKKKDPIQELKNKFNLTEREADIIRGLKDGLSYKQIGEKLYISHHTVNHHLKNVYLKLDVTSKNELVANYLLNKQTA